MKEIFYIARLRGNMKTFFYYIIILSFSLTNILCSNSKLPNLVDGSTALSNHYFPNQIGDKWVYQRIDSTWSNSVKTETIKVTITDTISVGNSIEATIWAYQYPDTTVYRYVVDQNNLVLFYDSKSADYFVNSYQLPLAINGHWRGQIISDTAQVISENDSLNVPAGVFKDGYEIHETAYGPNYQYSKIEFFVPYIGMVMMHRYERNLGPIDNSTWQLISYSLNPGAKD
ncbi:MAG: hypothetical protein ACRDE2_03280 [Chitinophagaceae bacterium]